MIVAACQRWREWRDVYRVPDETIRVGDYEVGEVSEKEAKAFVMAHHYSRSYPAARYRYGLHRHGQLVGVAVFSHPTRDEVLTNVFHRSAREACELGRFVLLPSVPSNGESHFVSRCFERLRREGLIGVVSFSDPVPRLNSRGERVFPGHVGTIYQASNAVYLGRATPRTLRLLPDGSVFSARAAQKIRAGERGVDYAVEQLVRHGAPPPQGDLRVWLRTAALPAVSRTVRHGGNLRYAWAFERTLRRELEGRAQPYLKVIPPGVNLFGQVDLFGKKDGPTLTR